MQNGATADEACDKLGLIAFSLPLPATCIYPYAT